jgi:membrane dipeptidase
MTQAERDRQVARGRRTQVAITQKQAAEDLAWGIPAWLRRLGRWGGSPRCAGHVRTIGIDMHNHVYPAGTAPHPQNSQPRRQEEQQQAPDPSMAEELKRSALTAVCASYVLDFAPNDKPGEARDNFLRWLTAIDAQLEKEHMHRALNLKDLQAAHQHGQPTIVQTVEGAQFIEGRLERVEEVYKRGVRHLQLLHQQDDLMSVGRRDHVACPARGDGFWTKVVKECNRLGILVDLAHARPETVLGALKVATQPLGIPHRPDGRTGGNPGWRR